MEETKNGKNKTYYMQNSVLNLLEKHKKETGVPKSTVVNKALEEYFEKRGVKESDK